MDGLSGLVDVVLDGGRCESGVESTVIDCSDRTARILRPGGVTRDDIQATFAGTNFQLDEVSASEGSDRPVSSGMLASHYAPKAGVAMNVGTAQEGMEFIGFGSVDGAGALQLNLSRDGNLLEAAANLFDMLHAADATGTALIGVAPIPGTGLGEAINDRLRRAAAPRTDRGPRSRRCLRRPVRCDASVHGVMIPFNMGDAVRVRRIDFRAACNCW